MNLAELDTIEARYIADCVKHEVLLYLPDADEEQAYELGFTVLPRIVRDLGVDALRSYIDVLTAASPQPDTGET